MTVAFHAADTATNKSYVVEVSTGYNTATAGAVGFDPATETWHALVAVTDADIQTFHASTLAGVKALVTDAYGSL